MDSIADNLALLVAFALGAAVGIAGVAVGVTVVWRFMGQEGRPIFESAPEAEEGQEDTE